MLDIYEGAPYPLIFTECPPRGMKLNWRWLRCMESVSAGHYISNAESNPLQQIIQDVLLPSMDRRDNGRKDVVRDDVYESVLKVVDLAHSENVDLVRIRFLMEAGLLANAWRGELISEEYGVSHWEQQLYEAAFFDVSGMLSNPSLVEAFVFRSADISSERAKWGLKAKIIAYAFGTKALCDWLKQSPSDSATALCRKVDSAIKFIKTCNEGGIPEEQGRKIAFQKLFEYVREVKEELGDAAQPPVSFIEKVYFHERDDLDIFAMPK